MAATSERSLAVSEEIVAREAAAIGSAMKIRFFPFVPARARGVRIWDADGNEYLDLTASGGVAQTGYGHERVHRAIVQALDEQHLTMHCCYPHPRAVELAERLCALVPCRGPSKVWFGATGSDASDCCARALPLATGRPRLVSFVGGYHGATAASAAISGHPALADAGAGIAVTKVPYPDPYRCRFGPCSREGCSLRCLEPLAHALGPDAAAVLIESVQSDGGEIVPAANVLGAVRELCDRAGAWLVCDEVKVGLGRTGRMFGFEHAGIEPDAVILGKPLGGGLPLSAIVGRAELVDAPMTALATLAGSPMPCAAALATLDVIQQEGLVENAAAMGARLLEGLTAIQQGSRLLGDVRGKGLILGAEFVRDRATREPSALDAHRFVYRLFELGVITIYSGLGSNVIELTPPLTIAADEVDAALELFARALADVEAGRFDDAKLAAFCGW